MDFCFQSCLEELGIEQSHQSDEYRLTVTPPLPVFGTVCWQTKLVLKC